MLTTAVKSHIHFSEEIRETIGRFKGPDAVFAVQFSLLSKGQAVN
jgi:hypothetical protein